MSSIPSNVLYMARLLASKSDMHHQMSTVIYKGRNIIAVGINRRIVDTRTKCHIKSFKLPYNSIHCEVDAVLSVPWSQLRGARAYIYRSRGNNAMPCPQCFYILRKLGISKINWLGE